MLKLIMDKNGAAFSEEVAEQEQSEQRHLANKAREQLIAANGWPGCRHATYVQGYRDALNDLLRKRPVLQPCVHAVALDRVRYTGLLHCGSCQCNSQAASLYPIPWPCRDTTALWCHTSWQCALSVRYPFPDKHLRAPPALVHEPESHKGQCRIRQCAAHLKGHMLH
jgi:hypothetical protein